MKTENFFDRICIFRNMKAKYIQSSEGEDGKKNVKSTAEFRVKTPGMLQLFIVGGLIISFFIFPQNLISNFKSFESRIDTCDSKIDKKLNLLVLKFDSMKNIDSLCECKNQLAFTELKYLIDEREYLIEKEFTLQVMAVVMTSIIWISMFLFLFLSIRIRTGKKSDVWV